MAEDGLTDIGEAKTAGELLAILTHEMRNPTTMIIGCSDVLLNTTGPITDDQRRFIEVIRNCALTLQNLRQQHLDALKTIIGSSDPAQPPTED